MPISSMLRTDKIKLNLFKILLLSLFVFLALVVVLFFGSQKTYAHDNANNNCIHVPNQWVSCYQGDYCRGPDSVNDGELCYIDGSGNYSGYNGHSNCSTIKGELHMANAPQCKPDCNDGVWCNETCSAPANTCGTNNGTERDCNYTSHTSGADCNWVWFESQPCSKNNCSPGFTCQGDKCVASPTATPTLPPPSGNPCEPNCGPFPNCYDGSTKICHYSSGSNCLQCNAPDSANCTPSGCKLGPTATPTPTTAAPRAPTPTPRPTSAPPRATSTPAPRAPTATPRPTTPPGVTVPPAATSTPRPTTPPVATATPRPTLLPTATLTPAASPTPLFNPAACKCDGIEPTEIFSGQALSVTSFAKVEGQDVTRARVVDQKFFLAEGAETMATIIARSNPIPSTVVSSSPTLIRYASKWDLRLPQLKSGATYRIWSQINCQPKTTVYTGSGNVLSEQTEDLSLFQKILRFFGSLFGGGAEIQVVEPEPTVAPVSGSSPSPQDSSIQQFYDPTPAKRDNLQLDTFYPGEIYQKTCSFIKFRFNGPQQ